MEFGQSAGGWGVVVDGRATPSHPINGSEWAAHTKYLTESIYSTNRSPFDGYESIRRVGGELYVVGDPRHAQFLRSPRERAAHELRLYVFR